MIRAVRVLLSKVLVRSSGVWYSFRSKVTPVADRINDLGHLYAYLSCGPVGAHSAPIVFVFDFGMV